MITRKVPGVVLVEVDFGDDGNSDGLRCAFAAEIVHHELLVRWMETESRWQLKLRCHFFFYQRLVRAKLNYCEI